MASTRGCTGNSRIKRESEFIYNSGQWSAEAVSEVSSAVVGFGVLLEIRKADIQLHFPDQARVDRAVHVGRNGDAIPDGKGTLEIHFLEENTGVLYQAALFENRQATPGIEPNLAFEKADSLLARGELKDIDLAALVGRFFDPYT